VKIDVSLFVYLISVSICGDLVGLRSLRRDILSLLLAYLHIIEKLLDREKERERERESERERIIIILVNTWGT